ncbi:MAG: NAD(P)-binding oxidoreductase [Meiothermus sp.]|nr:NAD(P)-binding oxidoreductase [Meiothermus sp.]
MEIVVFGASRGVGRQVVDQALEGGHRVTAFSRTGPDLAHPGLRVVRGDVLDPAALETALAGQQAAVIALGAGNTAEGRVRSLGTQSVVEAMRRVGVRRAVAVSSFGVGDSRRGPVAAMAWVFLRAALEEHERQEEILRESGLDYTIVRPTGLTDGPRTGRYKVGSSGSGRISRADVAEFVLRVLPDPQWHGRAVVVSS